MASSCVHILVMCIYFSLCRCMEYLYSHLVSTRFFGNDEALAVGYDETADAFLFAGGMYNRRQFIILQGKAFADYGATYLPENTHGLGSHYAQINNELWMLNDNGQSFTILHTEAPYKATIPPITIPIAISPAGSGCIAMTENHIFVIGGSATNATQIYDVEEGEWLVDVPHLPSPRMNAGCLIISNVLYLVGGVHLNENNETVYIKSTLSLDISVMSAISSQQWTYFSSLLVASNSVKAVAYGTDIIMVGLQNANQSVNRSEDIYVIDTKSGSCMLQGTLELATAKSGLIVHEKNHTLYVFGGSYTENQWQYIPLTPINYNGKDNAAANQLEISGVAIFAILCFVGFCIALYNRYCWKRKKENDIAESMRRIQSASGGSSLPKNVENVVQEEKIQEVAEGEESSTFSNHENEGPKQTITEVGDADAVIQLPQHETNKDSDVITKYKEN